MRLLAMSDIHGRFGQFPPSEMPFAEICIIAGDITNRGLWDTREFRQSEQWLADIVRRYSITLWIPGNHDLQMPADVYEPIGSGMLGRGQLHCIHNQRCEFDGISFFGVSMSPCYDKPELASTWCHMTTRREVEQAAYAQIPQSTDVVVSHCPPLLMLDKAGVTQTSDGSPVTRSIGSVELRHFIEKHQPQAVICGHVHEAAGHLRYGQTDVYNVAEQWRVIEVEG